MKPDDLENAEENASLTTMRNREGSQIPHSNLLFQVKAYWNWPSRHRDSTNTIFQLNALAFSVACASLTVLLLVAVVVFR